MRPFFTPPRVAYRNRKGARISDNDLLIAWSHLSDERVEECAEEGNEAASRVLELRHPTPNKEA